MGKNKLRKFADMEVLPNVFQLSYNDILNHGARFEMRGNWCERYFGNSNPIVLELGCGKGEYAVGLARRFPDCNFIGVDIKGARMWTGATEAHSAGLSNCAFLRTAIEAIPYFFAENEVDEIWITFADPQMKKVNKRLTSTFFMNLYKKILRDNGRISLKTDSNFLYTYTCLMAETSGLPVDMMTPDLYSMNLGDSERSLTEIQTFYEQHWRSMGKTIKFIRFRLPHDSQLVEPDVEIEKDDYTIKTQI
ncbi:MAG: tRNA (guanosine(46)-N7)-methyltransferase TrmB [Paludibacteraceae bacterium]|nr:tRNA (guanosine(46)-N7)-methyltransferase TrmB [Paludibacteraceae bacterium]